METKSFSLFSFLFSLSSVSTLPIRNGNKVFNCSHNMLLFCKYLTYKEWKQTLYSRLDRRSWGFRKYLTYKEWKPLSFREFTGNITLCKYLTYKEWKRYEFFVRWNIAFFKSKYLTYKEWKLLLFFLVLT